MARVLYRWYLLQHLLALTLLIACQSQVAENAEFNGVLPFKVAKDGGLEGETREISEKTLKPKLDKKLHEKILHRSKRFTPPLGSDGHNNGLQNSIHRNNKNTKGDVPAAGSSGVHLNLPFMRRNNLLTNFDKHGADDDWKQKQRAKCGNKLCHEDAHCYRRRCRCRRGLTGDGINSCSHTCKCTVSGDPHFHTFDGQTIHLMSNCTHVLSESVDITDECQYKITIRNEKRGANKFVSWPRLLDFYVYNRTIRLGPGKNVFIDGKKASLPFSGRNGELHVFESTNSMQVITHCGVQMNFNGDDLAEIQTSERYQGYMQGLCGDCNGIKDDLRTKEGVDVTHMKDKYSLIGLSYLVNDTATTPQRSCISHDFVTHCSSTTKAMYASALYCGFIIDKQSVFAECNMAYPNQAQQYFESCMYDVCAYESDNVTIMKTLCSNMEAFAHLCLEYGYTADWRDKEFCPMQCPQGQHYSPEVSGCPATCMEPDAPNNCSLPAREGCECKTGKLFNGKICVDISQCGCFQSNGQYIPMGKRQVSSNCSSVINCKDENGQPELEVTNMTCALHAECVQHDDQYMCQCLPDYQGDGTESCVPKNTKTKLVRSDEKYIPDQLMSDVCNTCHVNAVCVNRKCVCRDNYEGDGVRHCQKKKCGTGSCHDNAFCHKTRHGFKCVCKVGFTGNGIDVCDVGQCTCYASGDPHYRSFDTQSFYLSGDCKYTMTKTTRNVNHPFNVEVKNEHRVTRHHWKRSFTRLVDVKINDHTYRLHLNKYLTVDGKKTALPYKTSNGHINITMEDNHYMKLEFIHGLIVRFDGLHKVVITLGANFAENVEGLCGNCDSNPANDLWYKGKAITHVTNDGERYEKFAKQFLVADDTDKPPVDKICKINS